MAWVKVIKKFKDKHTGEIHEEGDKMNVSKDRIVEIQNVGNFVEAIVKNESKEEEASE